MIFDLLREIEKRTAMYVTTRDDGGAALRDMELLIEGYNLALYQHGMSEPGRDFLKNFGEYLRGRFKWSMSCGPIVAVRGAAPTEDEAWALFWKLIWEYEAHLRSEAGQG